MQYLSLLIIRDYCHCKAIKNNLNNSIHKNATKHLFKCVMNSIFSCYVVVIIIIIIIIILIINNNSNRHLLTEKLQKCLLPFKIMDISLSLSYMMVALKNLKLRNGMFNEGI